MIVNQKRLCCSIYPYGMRGTKRTAFLCADPPLQQGTRMNTSPENVCSFSCIDIFDREYDSCPFVWHLFRPESYDASTGVVGGALGIWLCVAPSSWFLIKPFGAVGEHQRSEYQAELGVLLGTWKIWIWIVVCHHAFVLPPKARGRRALVFPAILWFSHGRIWRGDSDSRTVKV
jgi:hypothetical protein